MRDTMCVSALAFVVAGLGGAACNSILGIDDHVLATGDASSDVSVDASVGDCAIQGGTCQTYFSGDAGLEDAASLEGGPAPDSVSCAVVNGCTGPSSTWQCQGSQYLYKCIDGVGYGYNCQSRNETCETRGTDMACYFQNTPCFGTSGICDQSSNTAIVCADGYQDSWQCSSGTGCVADPANNEAYCVTPGCASTTCTPSCDPDGHTMHLCIGNAPVAVDCRNYTEFYSTNSGFSLCIDNGTPTAPDPTCL